MANWTMSHMLACLTCHLRHKPLRQFGALRSILFCMCVCFIFANIFSHTSLCHQNLLSWFYEEFLLDLRPKYVIALKKILCIILTSLFQFTYLFTGLWALLQWPCTWSSDISFATYSIFHSAEGSFKIRISDDVIPFLKLSRTLYVTILKSNSVSFHNTYPA